VGLDTCQFQYDPAPVLPDRIFKKDIFIDITGKCTAQGLEKVLITIPVKISEAHGMSLLDLPKSSGAGDIVKGTTFPVSKHFIRYDRGELRVAGTQIEIEKTVGIQVTIVTAHGEN